jgi:hypothetical protein
MHMTNQDLQKFIGQSSEKAQWTALHPMALVAAAREAVYSEIPQSQRSQPNVIGPLEEVISRFEQQTRVALGSGSYAPTQTSVGS